MRTCSTCKRADVGEVNAQLKAGKSVRSTAEAFGIPSSNLKRHAVHVTGPSVAPPNAGRQAAAALALIEEMQAVKGDEYSAQDAIEAEHLLAIAAVVDQRPADVGALRELRMSIAGFRHQLEAGPDPFDDPEYVALTAAMTNPDLLRP
jgi:hypothetical protein